MAWTAPTTQTTGTLITASIWNTDIVDNLDILKDPPTDYYLANEASNWQTSSTSFTNTDGTLLSVDVTTTADSTDLLATMTGNVQNSTGDTYFDLLVNGARLAGDDGIQAVKAAATPGTAFTLVRWIRGLAAATHTIKLQWKVSTGTSTLFAGAGTANGDLHPDFVVREVS